MSEEQSVPNVCICVFYTSCDLHRATGLFLGLLLPAMVVSPDPSLWSRKGWVGSEKEHKWSQGPGPALAIS